jgi:Tfp pilus assembly PilM family ATPase
VLCVIHEGALVFTRTVERGAWRECVLPAATRLKVEAAVIESAFDASLVAQHARSREQAKVVERECRQSTTAYLEAMCPEVSRSLAYVAQRYATEITRLTLSGEGAATPGLAQRLARSVPGGVATSCWKDACEGVGPAMAVAVGLAMPSVARPHRMSTASNQEGGATGRAA